MSTQDGISAITGGLIQQDRLLKLDTPLGANALVPQRAVGRSRIGRHFEFTIDVVSTSSSVELKTLIAQPVTLWIQQADKSYLPHNGYVHTARRLGSDSGLTSYQLGFASWMYFLKFRRDQRIWQDKSADEIVTDVFNTHPQAQGMFQFALSQPLPSRSYCRQDEDDWNFVHRLLESEGLFGLWQQAQDGKSHTLVITDRLATAKAMSPETVKFYRAGTSSETDALTQWSCIYTSTDTSLADLTLTDAQWQATHRHGLVNRALGLHMQAMERQPDPQEVEAAVASAARAEQYGLSDRDDIIAFIGHALAWHPQFDRYPKVTLALQQREPDDFYTATVNELSPDEIEEIRRGNWVNEKSLSSAAR